MSDEDPPDDHASEPPPSGPSSPRERFRSRLESVIPEILKRAVEIGVEKARESPDNLKQFVHDMKLPKEIAHYLLVQIDETKNGLFRVVAKEIRDFLEHTNFSGELQKLLTTVQFEVNTTIRFTPNDGRHRDDDDGGDDGGPRDEGEPGGDTGDAPDRERRGSSPPESQGGRNPLPKPEVKTKVHVRRDVDGKRHREARRPRRGDAS